MAEKKKKRLVLLDSHAVLHRAFHAMPGFTSPKGEPTGALYGFLVTVLKTINDFKPDYIAACFDLPKPTFRHEIYKAYKAKRPKMADELSSQIERAKEALELLDVPIYEHEGFEADDVLATIVEKLKPRRAGQEDLEIIVVTGDLDTLQLIRLGVRIYTMKRGIKDSVFYDEKAVIDRYGFGPELVPDFKGLMGDPSDNIIGVVGIGEKTAKTLISKLGSLEDIYKKLDKGEEEFIKAGIKPRIINLLKENKKEALFSKALALSKRDIPVDFSLEDSRWNADFSSEKLKDFLMEHGFRSLINKVVIPAGDVKISQTSICSTSNVEHETKLAFWLLDSRKTNPSTNDILSEMRVKSLETAKEKILDKLKKDKLNKLYEDVELPLIKILEGMQDKGILLDVDFLKNLSKEYHKKLDSLQNKIWKLAGGEFNIRSPKQLSEVLFKKLEISPKGMRKTGTGAISTRFSELEKIQDRHEIIKEIFSYRELAKLTSTYVDNLPGMVGEDGRLHTTFNQTGTATGRLSSSDPNLQNIPTRTEFGRAVRKAFVAPRGWSLVSFDYSQIELRIVASLSQDKKLISAFKNKADIHAKVASEVFNVKPEDVTKEMRRRAKIINFGIAYGMGINSLKKNLECTKEEAQKFYDEYFHDFPGITEYMESTKSSVRKKGYSETLLGRRRYLPEASSPIEYIRKEAERMAINAPIQGTAADIIKVAMVDVDKILKEKKLESDAKLLLQVHDELIFEIKDDIVEKVVPIIESAMEKDVLPKVTTEVDVLVGKNWGTLRKLT